MSNNKDKTKIQHLEKKSGGDCIEARMPSLRSRDKVNLVASETAPPSSLIFSGQILAVDKVLLAYNEGDCRVGNIVLIHYRCCCE